MVAVTVPIAIPTGRASREDMLAGPSAIEVIITETTAARALERSEISVVLRSDEIALPAGAIEIAFSVIKRTETIAAGALDCSKISIALEPRDTIGAIERRDVPARIESRSLRKRPRRH